DGEQSPDVAMSAEDKCRIAVQLTCLGVDIIEAGFPAASEGDEHAVRRVAARVGRWVQPGMNRTRPPVICALARATRRDIDLAARSLGAAQRPRIHTFLATSPVHREHKLAMSCVQVLERIGNMVAYARRQCDDVQFSPEDAARTESEFLYEAIEIAIAAGATTINIPDTVGYTEPREFHEIIAGIKEKVVGIEQAVLSVHCHDDLGLAAANTLAGLRGGARQAELTINGIGERAGNAALEEVVMALHTRRERHGLTTRIDTTLLHPTSKLVSEITGMVVAPNKAIVGHNAFAHEAGIHQDGMLKSRDTYEIMRPETVGAPESRLVLGKHSGRHALAARLRSLDVHLDDVELDLVFSSFKAVADKRGSIPDDELVALTLHLSAERPLARVGS
ncbi:MAG: 2-isopropylmalate synthase, partial [Polyangiaceae bacterium]